MKQQDPLHELYKKILDGSARPGDKERLAMWMARFDAPRKEISAEDLLQEQRQAQLELKEHFFPPAKRISLMRTWIAAACFIPVLLGMLLLVKIRETPSGKNLGDIYARTSTAAGEKKLVVLGDGSRVFMNGQSSIRYQQTFAGKTREVYLQGQAYFQVAPNKKRPFIIHTGNLVVHVLGTTFDVRNYADDPQASVTVATGKVGVRTPAATGSRMLIPGERLVYDKKTGIAAQHSVDPVDYTGWRKGAQVFRNSELREICKLLERSYGVKILIQTPALETKKLNFRIKGGENIARIMEMLSATGGFRYAVKDRKITLWK